MAEISRIEWTESTWNPITGCTKISEGCVNCYADRMARRLKAMGSPLYSKEFEPTFHQEVLEKPLSWKKSKMIFVNSMSDTFHESINLSDIKKIFNIMNKARWHTFQVLTKRSDRLLKIANKLNWTPNIWLGVTIESAKYRYRLEDLRRTPAQTKFLSLEPLLSNIPGLNLKAINWVIVGGESGPNSRVMKKEWVIPIREKCKHKNVPFFFKQWGGKNKKKNGRILENQTWSQMPDVKM
jgi:protein gp37